MTLIDHPAATPIATTHTAVAAGHSSTDQPDANPRTVDQCSPASGPLLFDPYLCLISDSLDDIDALQDDLERGVRWYPTLGEAIAFVEGGGFKDSYVDEEMVLAFVKAATTVVVSEGSPRKAVES